MSQLKVLLEIKAIDPDTDIPSLIGDISNIPLARWDLQITHDMGYGVKKVQYLCTLSAGSPLEELLAKITELPSVYSVDIVTQYTIMV